MGKEEPKPWMIRCWRRHPEERAAEQGAGHGSADLGGDVAEEKTRIDQAGDVACHHQAEQQRRHRDGEDEADQGFDARGIDPASLARR